jgi:predicted RNA binding protein YcfA (HicA-like mRNA interferase family)
MTQHGKILDIILRGNADHGILFGNLRSLLLHLGFEERIRGSHHIFTRFNIREILNLQPKGSHAKPYQVKQVREIIVRYGIGNIDDDS